MITYEQARHAFSYRKDGVLIWKNPVTKHVKKGDIAGHMKKDGYCQMNYKGKQYKRNRLVWLWHNGSFPERNIYHKNGNHSDDRIENLALIDKKHNVNKITQKMVKDTFSYRKNGKLVWKKYTGGTGMVRKGSVAGSLSGNGYNVIGFKGKRYKSSHLIWLWHKGYLPENFIDHINQVKTDDRIENLREVTNGCNMRNAGNNKGNTSGVKGVHWHEARIKWIVYINFNNKRYYIGYHEDFVEAVFHRFAAEQCLDWEGCEENSPAYKYLLDNGFIKEVKREVKREVKKRRKYLK